MSTYKEIFQRAQKILLTANPPQFGNAPKRTVLFEAEVLFALSTGQDNARLLKNSREQMPKAQEELFLAKIKERQEGRPLQYIVGKWAFFNETYFVGEGVLIPRSDTEILVEKTIALIGNSQNNKNPIELLDLCSGSGCVAISIQKNTSNINVQAVEVSELAFSYLTKNIAYNGAKVTPIRGDVKQLVNTFSDNFFDFIVSNPPYVTKKEYEAVTQEVKREPALALLGQSNGLEFYQFFVDKYTQKLKTGGWFLFEIGYRQGEAVAKLLRDKGFDKIEVVKDYGHRPRVVLGRKKETI